MNTYLKKSSDIVVINLSVPPIMKKLASDVSSSFIKALPVFGLCEASSAFQMSLLRVPLGTDGLERVLAECQGTLAICDDWEKVT